MGKGDDTTLIVNSNELPNKQSCPHTYKQFIAAAIVKLSVPRRIVRSHAVRSRKRSFRLPLFKKKENKKKRKKLSLSVQQQSFVGQPSQGNTRVRRSIFPLFFQRARTSRKKNAGKGDSCTSDTFILIVCDIGAAFTTVPTRRTRTATVKHMAKCDVWFLQYNG